jgi:glycosyltransferase involved in cell wall biosynthesis
LTVSIIIPTYNGSHRILNVLRALEDQTVSDFEVIVAIDGSEDRTKEVLENHRVKFNRFKVIEQTNKGRASIRNFGAGKADGDLLIFYDDDTIPANDSIEKHVEFSRIQQNCLCGGIAIEDPGFCKTDIQKYKRHLSLKWTAKYQQGLNKLNRENLFLTAANFSIPKSIFDKLGGFDERLTDGEDFELGVRALHEGLEVYFDKSNMAWHDDFITCRSYILRQRQYTKANKSIEHKLPAQYRRKPINTANISWFKKVVYSIFGRKYFVDVIDKEILWWLPKNIRYRIYDWTITSLGRISTSRCL